MRAITAHGRDVRCSIEHKADKTFGLCHVFGRQEGAQAQPSERKILPEERRLGEARGHLECTSGGRFASDHQHIAFAHENIRLAHEIPG